MKLHTRDTLKNVPVSVVRVPMETFNYIERLKGKELFSESMADHFVVIAYFEEDKYKLYTITRFRELFEGYFPGI